MTITKIDAVAEWLDLSSPSATTPIFGQKVLGAPSPVGRNATP